MCVNLVSLATYRISDFVNEIYIANYVGAIAQKKIYIYICKIDIIIRSGMKRNEGYYDYFAAEILLSN